MSETKELTEIERLVNDLHRKNMMVDDGCEEVAPIFPTYLGAWSRAYRDGLVADAMKILDMGGARG